MKTKVMNELKELYQNCPDTMNLIKVIVASSLFSAFLVFAPHEVVMPVMLIAVIAAIIGLIMRKNKSKKSKDRAERRKIEHEIILNKQMDKTDPYPERIYIKKDSLRSDLFCMQNYGSAYMTVVLTADESTVSYIREDSIPAQKDNQELSEIIEKQKESLFIWKDRVLSLQSANLAVKMTDLILLKRLVLRFFICYFLMFMTTAVFYGYYTYIKENNILIYAGIIFLLLVTMYISWYASKQIRNLQIQVDDYQFQKLEDERKTDF